MRGTASYQPRLSAKDVPVIEAMKALSAQYPRYGDPSLTIFRGRR